jgi:UDP-N-acetylglucosamine:LPS N-acetylglucosamine transferase
MKNKNDRPAKRVLAVASGGGHWVQLMRLLPAFEGTDVTFVSVNSFRRDDVRDHRFFTIPDASRWNKYMFIPMAFKILWILLLVRPHVVVTTGSAPGYATLRLAKYLGSRTVWIDSISQIEALSMSGQLAGKVADLWLTQWPHLAKPEGPEFSGTIL